MSSRLAPRESPMTQRDEDIALNQALLRLNGRAWGIGMGLLLGIALFMATNILVARGGEDMGQHLGLLAIYLPGYNVSFAGSLIGFVYAFVGGYALGRLIGEVYNRLIDFGRK
jgi:hypothetical protein